MKKKRIGSIAIVLGLVSIVILFNTGCHKNSATMIVDGTIDCDEINVSSKVTGRIKDLFVDEGTIHSLPLTARCWASFDADRAMCCRFFFEWLQTMLCGIQQVAQDKSMESISAETGRVLQATMTGRS